MLSRHLLKIVKGVWGPTFKGKKQGDTHIKASPPATLSLLGTAYFAAGTGKYEKEIISLESTEQLLLCCMSAQSNVKPKCSPISTCSGMAHNTSRNWDELSLRSFLVRYEASWRAALTHLVVRWSWWLVHIPGNKQRKSSNPVMSINSSYYPSLLPKQIMHFMVALDFTLQLILLFCLV